MVGRTEVGQKQTGRLRRRPSVQPRGQLDPVPLRPPPSQMSVKNSGKGAVCKPLVLLDHFRVRAVRISGSISRAVLQQFHARVARAFGTILRAGRAHFCIIFARGPCSFGHALLELIRARAARAFGSVVRARCAHFGSVSRASRAHFCIIGALGRRDQVCTMLYPLSVSQFLCKEMLSPTLLEIAFLCKETLRGSISSQRNVRR